MNSSGEFSVLLRLGTQIEKGIQMWLAIPCSSGRENHANQEACK